MATFGRTTNLLRNKYVSPALTRNFSNVQLNNTSKCVLTACACAVGGGLAVYLATKTRRDYTVHALKTRVSALKISLKTLL